jgi:glutamine phosphoribosylpyrophosphate amidotransferase
LAAQREQERLAMMQPHELIAHFQEKTRQEMRQEMQQFRLESQEQTDRLAFASLKAREPIAARYEKDVEALVASERAAGRIVSREVALNFAIGKAIREKAPGQAATQRTAARARVASQTTRPGNQSGSPRDNRPSGDDLSSLEARLKGQTI